MTVFQNLILLFENSIDPDQLASDDASRSESTLFFISLMHYLFEGVFLFDLFLYIPVNNFSSWLEPVLSKDKCAMLKDTTQ